MGECRIRFAKYEDITSIMNFIDAYWKKGHILATDRKLFEWQYKDAEKVNFVLGIDEDEAIQGILGFVPYDKANSKDLALALWKANRSEPFLGIRLILFLKKEEPHRNIVCSGINMRTASKIYTQLGMKVDVMKQWYRLRNNANYVIGKIVNTDIPKVNESDVTIERLLTKEEIDDRCINLIEKDNAVPYKSADYLRKRYFNHPTYEYLVYKVSSGEASAVALFVLRVQECCGSKVFRFVDYVGNKHYFKYITPIIDTEMEKYQVEYVDMYEAGIEDDTLEEAGWLPVKESGNVIPNYFSPFEQSIVDIYYCTSDPNAILFRGDGDQDRPN